MIHIVSSNNFYRCMSTGTVVIDDSVSPVLIVSEYGCSPVSPLIITPPVKLESRVLLATNCNE